MILQFIFAVCRRFELSCVNLLLKIYAVTSLEMSLSGSE